MFIHPFADGNGRTGRTLLNYWLIINNHPPLIVYDEDKREYYAAPKAYDESEDAQTGKTWEKDIGEEPG